MAIIVQCISPKNHAATHTYDDGVTVQVFDGVLTVIDQDDTVLGAYPSGKWISSFNDAEVKVSF